MTLLGVGLPRRGSLFRKLMIGGILMFISCWITVLMLQNSADSSVSNTGRSQDHKLPYMPAHNNVPRDENVYIKKNSTVKQQQDSVGKNTPHFPRKTLLSTREHSATNKTNQNTTIKAAHKSVPRIDSIPSMNGPNSVELLRKKLVTLNREERILNADKFAPLGNDDIILIVQVHKRVAYLRQLLDSLRAARGVEEVLLVVSSDYYYEEMNQIVESVDFCKVLQIFYPFSLQVFPDSFPGQSKTDCPRDVNREKAIEMNCTNALHPDSFGHYREAKVTAIKHHWWWKVNTVFDHLRVTTDFNGYVFFLEEDHYLSPDFVHVAKRLVALKREQCQDCDLVNMGTYQKSSFAAMSSQASPSLWNAGKNNMGFGMDRSTWNTIKGCREKFCSYDDYNWDWSLNSLGNTCLGKKLKVLVMKAPRIIHIGTCGTHHHHKSCNEAEQARVAREGFSQNSAHLFPESLQLANPQSMGARALKNYGGWGDTRDHQLCLSFVTT